MTRSISGSLADYAGHLTGKEFGKQIEALQSTVEGKNFNRLVTEGLTKVVPHTKTFRRSLQGQLDEAKEKAIEALQPVLSAGEGVYRSKDFEQLRGQVDRQFADVADWLKSVVESEEFKALTQSLLQGMRGTARSWKAVINSDEYAEFKRSLKSLV